MLFLFHLFRLTNISIFNERGLMNLVIDAYQVKIIRLQKPHSHSAMLAKLSTISRLLKTKLTRFLKLKYSTMYIVCNPRWTILIIRRSVNISSIVVSNIISIFTRRILEIYSTWQFIFRTSMQNSTSAFYTHRYFRRM